MKKIFLRKSAVLAWCMICFMFVGCGTEQEIKESEGVESTVVQEETEVNNVDVQEEVLKEKTEENSGIEIDTPYGKLRYSEEWYDYLNIETLDTEDRYQVDFFAKYDEYEDYSFLLFSIIYGDDEEGMLLGSFEGQENSEVPVYLLMQEIEIPENFPDNLVESVYAMQEEVNSIVAQISSTSNFRAK